MTPSALLLWMLLQSVGAAAAPSQCHQGATIPEAVLAPALSSGSSVLRVPGVASLARCRVSCCERPRCDLAWLFQGRCYILSCQQGGACRPQNRPGADSYLAFVLRGPAQTLVLGPLVRGEPYGSRWGPPSEEEEEAPGDLEALRDLAVLEGEEGPPTRGGDLEPGGFSHWPAAEIENRGEGPVTVNGSAGGPPSPGALRGQLGEQSPTFHPAESRGHISIFSGTQPSHCTSHSVALETNHLPHPKEPYKDIASHRGHAPALCYHGYSDNNSSSPLWEQRPYQRCIAMSFGAVPGCVSAERLRPHAVVDPPSQVLSPPVQEVVLNASQSRGDALLRCGWEQTSGPSVDLGRSADTWSLHLAHLEPGNYTFRGTVTDSAGSSDSTTATVLVLPADPGPPPGVTPTTAPPSTSDPTLTPPPRHDADPTVPSPTPIPPQMRTTPTVTVQVPLSPTEERRLNLGPTAVAGPDRKLVLPVSSVTLDGRDSSDDRAVVQYHWEATSGRPGLKMEGVDRAVATATGLRVGRYTFRLTVSDQQGATDSAVLTVRVEEARLPPPVAHASGSHALTLPNSSLVLRGSVTDGDQSQVTFLWARDSQSPAAGDVLYGSQTQPSLHLSNLVEGTYLFQLRVTDAQGRGSTATATVEVRPDPAAREEVDLEVLVGVSQVSAAQRDTVVRQLAALLHVLDNSIQLRILPGHSPLSAVLRLSVRGPEGSFSGSRLAQVLRNQLLREKTDYLLFRVLRVDTVYCLLRCSGRGQCDPITKECVCDPFWTENLIRRFLGDKERNCEWRMLYVILSSLLALVLVLTLSWSLVCCCRRRKRSKPRKKTKYTILDDMDDQERLELRPKHGLKHRSTEHASSLMMSESELDSEPDALFSRAPGGHGARNGNAFG
ncbi:dyslexia-associated protein KIAA0319 homolog [Gadus chalcogrammus]|uniref:dyslexia-associated protein KIAA0319 homolog n=1 Tax=Gadus chalcogrammus TaxID=1042646 RepID=UPI0024C265DD|nr:dyslexia-associated protein KIAA0319 homolog [Gadus chalcogrammus]